MAAPAALPRLVAFDLDATLWEPEMYLCDGPPFKAHPKAPGCLVDAAGEKMFLLGESRAILAELATEERWAGTAVAYVSRTEHPRWAAACLRLFQVADGLSMHDVGAEQEIYPGGKQKHFTRIAERTGLAFESMLFFDNEVSSASSATYLLGRSIEAETNETANHSPLATRLNNRRAGT